MPKIVVNGVELNYEEHGSGEERVVFIHGARGAATTWRDVLALLPANYHAYALDLRGHGQSAHVTEGCTMSQWANDVYRFSLELGLGKFVYVGVSMGGGVGIQLVIDHPEVLKAAVLVSPDPDGVQDQQDTIRQAKVIITWEPVDYLATRLYCGWPEVRLYGPDIGSIYSYSGRLYVLRI